MGIMEIERRLRSRVIPLDSFWDYVGIEHIDIEPEPIRPARFGMVK